MSKINNEIQEDYCSFEVSKLLKEKGFDAPCRGRVHCSHYHLVKDNIIPSNIPTHINETFAPVQKWNRLKERDPNSTGFLEGLNTSIPTHALAIKWIRENFQVNINVFPVHQYNEGREDYLNLVGWQFILTVSRDNKRDQDKSVSSILNYPSSESATEAALLYTLQNLIPSTK